MSPEKHVCVHDADWEMVKRMGNQIDAIYGRMFVDNGKPSMQSEIRDMAASHKANASRIKTLEDRPKVLVGMIATVCTILGGIGGAILWAMAHVKVTP